MNDSVKTIINEFGTLARLRKKARDDLKNNKLKYEKFLMFNLEHKKAINQFKQRLNDACLSELQRFGFTRAWYVGKGVRLSYKNPKYKLFVTMLGYSIRFALWNLHNSRNPFTDKLLATKDFNEIIFYIEEYNKCINRTMRALRKTGIPVKYDRHKNVLKLIKDDEIYTIHIRGFNASGYGLDIDVRDTNTILPRFIFRGVLFNGKLSDAYRPGPSCNIIDFDEAYIAHHHFDGGVQVWKMNLCNDDLIKVTKSIRKVIRQT